MATGMVDFHRPFMQNNIGSITVPSSKCSKAGGGGGGGGGQNQTIIEHLVSVILITQAYLSIIEIIASSTMIGEVR